MTDNSLSREKAEKAYVDYWAAQGARAIDMFGITNALDAYDAALNSRVEVGDEDTRHKDYQLAYCKGNADGHASAIYKYNEEIMQLREANRVLMDAASEYQNSVNSFNTTRKDTNLDVLIVADTKLTAVLALASGEV